MTLSSWRRLPDGRIGGLFVLAHPKADCAAVEVLVVGESLESVLQILRQGGFDRVRRPARGQRPTLEEVAHFDSARVAYLWRDLHQPSAWAPDSILR